MSELSAFDQRAQNSHIRKDIEDILDAMNDPALWEGGGTTLTQAELDYIEALLDTIREEKP